jgi:hypothetical protein
MVVSDHGCPGAFLWPREKEQGKAKGLIVIENLNRREPEPR